MGTHTIWGEAQQSKKLAPGIMRYDTAGHGGYHVSPTVNAKIPEALRMKDGWYEEDCQWSLLALARPDLDEFSSPETQAAAERTCRYWEPDAWEDWKGLPRGTLTAADSYKRTDHAKMVDHVIPKPNQS